MGRDVTSGNDIIDIRDVIERFEELESERAEIVQDAVDATSVGDDEQAEAEQDQLQEWDEDNGEEFKGLQSLLAELAGNGGNHDWRGDWYPITLIRDSYFVDAMQELVQDIGDLPRDIPSYLEIDWEKTADNLRVDYSSVEYDGVTYWYR